MKRILLVDDDFAVLEITKSVLEQEGFAVATATNGEDALAMAISEPPDMVVTDFMMPIMNGAELARRMRSLPSLAAIPIIMVSATTAPDVGLGIAFLPKPVTIDGLLGVIRRLLPDYDSE
jgi:two-component system response regulator VicR